MLFILHPYCVSAVHFLCHAAKSLINKVNETVLAQICSGSVWLLVRNGLKTVFHVKKFYTDRKSSNLLKMCSKLSHEMKSHC